MRQEREKSMHEMRIRREVLMEEDKTRRQTLKIEREAKKLKAGWGRQEESGRWRRQEKDVVGG